MLLFIYATVVFFLGVIAGYVLGKVSKEDQVSFVEHSELSDPTINIPPYWFYAPHYRILERISYFSWFGTPEFTYYQLDEWEKQGSRRAWELAKMWFLNVRSEKTIRGKRNYYKINKKGREALLQFNKKF